MEYLNEIKKIFIRNNLSLSTAESVTAGYIQLLISQIEGAHEFFAGGITAYNCAQKETFFGINYLECNSSDGVSKSIADIMALKCCNLFNTSMSIAITGYASRPHSINQGISLHPFAFIAIAYQNSIIENQLVAGISSFEENQKKYANAALSILYQSLNKIFLKLK